MKNLIFKITIVTLFLFAITGCSQNKKDLDIYIEKIFEHNLFKEYYFEYREVPYDVVTLGDFNGDGKLDWLALGRVIKQLAIHIQNENKLKFFPYNYILNEKNIPVCVYPERITNKTKDNILLLEKINPLDMKLVSYRLSAIDINKEMRFKENIIYNGDIGSSIIVEDINNDSAKEIILLEDIKEKHRVLKTKVKILYYNAKEKKFNAKDIYISSENTLISQILAIDDIDKNGYKDIMLVEYEIKDRVGSPSIIILYQQSKGSYDIKNYPLEKWLCYVSVLDINKDGRKELVKQDYKDSEKLCNSIDIMEFTKNGLVKIASCKVNGAQVPIKGPKTGEYLQPKASVKNIITTLKDGNGTKIYELFLEDNEIIKKEVYVSKEDIGEIIGADFNNDGKVDYFCHKYTTEAIDDIVLPRDTIIRILIRK